MFRIITVLLLLAFSAQGRSVCSNRVSIVVREVHDHTPVFPAVVYFPAFNLTVQTDTEGYCMVDSVCSGKLVFRFFAEGYVPFTDSIIVSSDTLFYLKPEMTKHLLAQVVIVDERIKTILQTKEQMNRTEILSQSGKSIGDVLQSVNGVTSLSNGATIVKPVIHGLHSNRILLLNNGLRQEDQQWGAEHAPNIDPFLAQTIKIIKGAAGVRYGTDAIGGVVLVEPAPLPVVAGWRGEVDAALFSNNRMGAGSAMIEHNSKKHPSFSFRAQGSYKQGGNYRIPGHWVANTSVYERNYSGALGYSKADKGVELFFSHFDTDLGIYRGSHTGNSNDLMNAILSSEPLIESAFNYDLQRPRQFVSHELAKVKFHANRKEGMWTATYGYQHNFRQEYDVLRRDNGKAQLNLTLNTHSLNINLDHRVVNGISGQAGIDGQFQDNFFRSGDRVFVPSYLSYSAASYLIERYSHSNYTIEAGMRFDSRWYQVHNPEGNSQKLVYYEFDYHNPSGTISFLQQLRHNWQWSVTAARAWRAPQINELFSAGLHHGAARVELGNKTLLPERAYSLNAETKYSLGGRWIADLAVYSQRINDFIYLEPGPEMLTIKGFFKTFNYKQTDAWLNGADISLQTLWTTHFSTTVKGSFLRAKDRTRKDWLILMPSDRVNVNVKYTVNISESLKACYLGTDLKYVFEQTRIPQYFDEVDYPRPPAAYMLWNASAGGQIKIRRQYMDVSLSVINIMNTRYRDYLDVFRYFIDQPGTNVVLRLHVPINII